MRDDLWGRFMSVDRDFPTTSKVIPVEGKVKAFLQVG